MKKTILFDGAGNAELAPVGFIDKFLILEELEVVAKYENTYVCRSLETYNLYFVEVRGEEVYTCDAVLVNGVTMYKGKFERAVRMEQIEYTLLLDKCYSAIDAEEYANDVIEFEHEFDLVHD